MPVGHGTWKASEPLSDPDQLLSIAKYDPNVNAKQVVSVCNTQQRLVHVPAAPHPRYEVPAVGRSAVAPMGGLGTHVTPRNIFGFKGFLLWLG